MPAVVLPVVRRGRPRKFARPARPVTLTLPEDVIAALQVIDTDLGRAVVRMVQPLVAEHPHPPAELSSYGGRAVIVVRRNPTLKRQTGIEFVPLSDGRALISFDDRVSVPQLELRIRDALDDATLDREDRAMFEALADILRSARQSDRMVLRQRSIIVLEWKGGHVPPGAEPRKGGSPARARKRRVRPASGARASR